MTWEPRVKSLAIDLTDTSGIEPPSRRFVLTAIGIYLVVLVPLNWLVFRLMSRVEWAWIAAPIIAILAAVGVVRAARLDIGFARSQSELAIIELPAGYDRAHVTRYSNLYTSLSTRFSVEFDSTVSRGQPWGSRATEQQTGDEREVTLNRAGALRLEDFSIPSNTAGLLHTEEFVGVGGRLGWTWLAGSNSSSPAGSLNNATELDLSTAVVVHRDDGGRWWAATVGSLSPGSTEELTLKPVDDEEQWHRLWMGSEETDYLGHEFLLTFQEGDQKLDGVLTVDELKAIPGYERSWLSTFQATMSEFEAETEEEEEAIRRGLPAREWPRLARRIAHGRFSCAGLIELWMKVARQHQHGTFLLGTLERFDETCHVQPLPSQREQSALLIAELSPAALPQPMSDLRLPDRWRRSFSEDGEDAESSDPESSDPEATPRADDNGGTGD
ncbi:MAG: hypothetical protein R3B96_23290 [Pirellulaceae bacterium]